MLADAIVIITLQYINVSNQYTVYLKLTQVKYELYHKIWGKKQVLLCFYNWYNEEFHLFHNKELLPIRRPLNM